MTLTTHTAGGKVGREGERDRDRERTQTYTMTQEVKGGLHRGGDISTES